LVTFKDKLQMKLKNSALQIKKKEVIKKTLIQSNLYIYYTKRTQFILASSYNLIYEVLDMVKLRGIFESFRKALYNKRLRKLFTFRQLPF